MNFRVAILMLIFSAGAILLLRMRLMYSRSTREMFAAHNLIDREVSWVSRRIATMRCSWWFKSSRLRAAHELLDAISSDTISAGSVSSHHTDTRFSISADTSPAELLREECLVTIAKLELVGTRDGSIGSVGAELLAK